MKYLVEILKAILIGVKSNGEKLDRMKEDMEVINDKLNRLLMNTPKIQEVQGIIDHFDERTEFMVANMPNYNQIEIIQKSLDEAWLEIRKPWWKKIFRK